MRPSAHRVRVRARVRVGPGHHFSRERKPEIKNMFRSFA